MDGKSTTRGNASKSVAAALRRPGTNRATGNREPSVPEVLPKTAAVPGPRETRVDANGSYEKSIERIAAVMDNVAQDTFFSSAKVLLEVLVNAADAVNPTAFSRCTDYIVKKAIAEQTRSNLYAHLCSEAYRKSLVDAREHVRTAFGEQYKREMVEACNSVLRAAGVLRQVRPNEGPEPRFGTKRFVGQLDVGTRQRTLGACRFLGELYTANTFKLFNAVKTNIDTFMRTRDELSLECLSVLLIVIRTRFEKVKEPATEWTAKKIYAELRRIACRGHADKPLPLRTIITIRRLLSLSDKIDGQTCSAVSNEVIVTTRGKTATGGRSAVAPANTTTVFAPLRAGAIETNEMLIQSVAAVMENVTQDTVSESSRAIFDIVARANEKNHLKPGRVINHIVQKAIDNPAKSQLYACLCSEAIKNASQDSRVRVRTKFADIFRTELLRSCNRVLSEAGIQNQARPGTGKTTTRIPKNVDATVRARSLKTCRFMGHLFMTKTIKLYSVVTRTVNALFKTRDDEHSLECLCELLTIIGPTYELVKETVLLNSPKILYDELKRLAVTGYVENTLSLRTVQMINRLLRLRDRGWSSQRPSLHPIETYHHSPFVQNVELETRYRKCYEGRDGGKH